MLSTENVQKSHLRPKLWPRPLQPQILLKTKIEKPARSQEPKVYLGFGIY